MLGKRKREVAVATRRSRNAEDEQPDPIASGSAHDIFRRYFEGAFEPLPESVTGTPSLQEDQEDDEDEEEELEDDEGDAPEARREDTQESDWEGLSDTEQRVPVVEVVEHRSVLDEREEAAELQRLHYKAFMVSDLNPNDRGPYFLVHAQRSLSADQVKKNDRARSRPRR